LSKRGFSQIIIFLTHKTFLKEKYMSTQTLTPQRSEAGFTLVELAIVMVIIGLLIGGVLKGQELIANARVTGTVADLKNTDAALNGFFEKYSGLPGDISNPGTRLANCTGVCNTAGDQDGRIEGTANTGVTSSPGIFPGAGTEARASLTQLSAADMISGINQNDGPVFGGLFANLKTGGGMWISYAWVAPLTSMNLNRHYVTLSGITGNPTATSGSLTGAQAAQIDRKLDDGVPNTGSFQTTGTGCTIAGPPLSYDERGQGTCTAYMRALN